jgi:peptide/nickel transport system permease protein
MSLTRYIGRRLLLMIPVAIGATLLIFLLLHLAPGDPARLILGKRQVTEELVRSVRQEFNLNEPLWKQYLLWLGNAVQGDLGRSFVFRRSVTDMILNRYRVTLELALSAWFISMLVGIPAGVISAVKQYTKVDYTATILALTGVSMPVFWQGILAIFVFAYVLGWLPSSGFAADAGLVTHLKHLLLPALTLGTSITALTVRLTRSAMLEVLNEDYIRTARAKGVSEWNIIKEHAFRNAMMPIVTVVGVQIGFLMAGSVLTETVFGIGGLGRLLVRAINKFDYPTIQGITLVVVLVFIMTNLLVDVLYTFINPKVRYDG